MSKGSARWTQEQLREWIAKGRKVEGLTHSTQPESFRLPLKSPQPSKPCSTTPKEPKLNKTELEFLEVLKQRRYRNIEPQLLKLRIGPPGERCHYTPDFVAILPDTDKAVMVEVKGPFEYEDARVKRMAAARWCQSIGWAFLFAQKQRSGTWVEAWLA